LLCVKKKQITRVLPRRRGTRRATLLEREKKTKQTEDETQGLERGRTHNPSGLEGVGKGEKKGGPQLFMKRAESAMGEGESARFS